MLEWEKALGYKENPFKRVILEPVSTYIANLENEKERLNLFIITNKKFGTINMIEDGYLKVLAGVTTVEEVLRVAQER